MKKKLFTLLLALVAIATTAQAQNTINGHEYVDLGLPSGTLWATCNVGASKPEDYGGYYAWGETEEKDYYDWSTYDHCDGTERTSHDIGNDIAGTQYDAATANWGSPWMMPNIDQIKELLDNCESERTTENGVKGYRYTGPNGVSVFFPAGSLRHAEVDRNYLGTDGVYWSSSLTQWDTDKAYELIFTGNDTYYIYKERSSGLSVRPVVVKSENPAHNDGDILQGTADGITWTYKIISEADKTCQIGDGNASAIATSTTGALNIPSSIDGYIVIAVGSWSLFYCNRLTSISIPATVINVYRYATPKPLTSLTVSANNPVLTDLDANIIVDRNTMTILAGCNVSQIPDGIVAIGDGAFRNCVFETTPTFPTSLKSIGEDVFSPAYGLKNLTLPEGLESIGYYGFNGSDIQSLYIPSTLTSLGSYAFADNPNLSEIKVSEDNPVFDSRNNCNAIIRTSSNRLVQGSNTTIIPDGIRTLGWGAFSGLESLKKMIIPEGVYDLGNYTFYGCTALEELSIPSTVSSDGFNETTFYDCLSLKTIYCYIDNPATLPSKYSGPFGSNYNPKERTYEQATLYVPYGTKSKYENTDGWNKFKNIVEMEYVPVAFGDRILIQERQVGDRKYNLYKSMASSNKRINGDGTPFYLTQITLDITDETGTESFVINEGTLYTNEWTDDLSWNWMSPCMMIDLDRKKMYVFSSSKATDAYYGMEGYVYSSPLNEPAFTNELVFEQANWGWYSFFGGVTDKGQPILKHFSYAGYYDFTSTRSDDGTWENVWGESMMPDDACARWDDAEKILVVGGTSEEDIDPVDEDDNIDFGSDMDENSDLDGNVIGDIYYNINTGDGGYDAAEGCIVLKKTTSDETVDGLSGKDIFGEDFKGQFTGIVFKVPAGKGTVKVTAETTGNMLLKVKIGDNDPVEMELNGKLKISFPYNVSETTFVAIYAGANNEAKGFGTTNEAEDAALKIYGIEFIRDETTAIGASLNDNGKMINDNYYSIDGKKLSGEPTKKGIYIYKGKKVKK